MNDPALNHHSTPSARAYSGTFLGLSFQLSLFVALAAGVGMVLFTLSYQVRGFWDSLAIGFLPPVGCALFLFWFFHEKPEGYFRDWIESRVNRGNAIPASDAVPLYTPLSDVQLAAGLIFYGGIDRGGVVAKGFQVELPPLDTASNAECNQREAVIRQLLRMTHRYGMHIHWYSLADYESELRRYSEETRRCEDPDVRRYRNRVVWARLSEAQAGELRRERVSLYLVRKVTVSHRDRAEQLRQLVVEFEQVGVELRNTLGRAIPMSDVDHLREFRRKLNPSWKPTLNLEPDLEPMKWWQSELRGGRGSFYLDNHYHAAVSLRQWPSQTHPAQFLRLTRLDGVEISVQLVALPLERLLAEEHNAVTKLKQQLESRPDERVRVTIEEKEEKIRRLSSGALLPLLVEYTFLVRGAKEDQLSERLLSVKNALHGLPGALYTELSLPASLRNAFFRSLPGNLFGPYLGIQLYGEDTFVSNVLPFGGSFIGRLATAEAIYSNPQGSVVGVSTFLGEGPAATPQNGIIFGSVGTGKSLWVTDLLEQTRPYYGYWVVIEEGGSQQPFARSLGIDPIILRADGSQTINAFDTRGLPMSALQISSIVGFVALCVGLPPDSDAAHLRLAILGKAVTQLIHDYGLERWKERSDRIEILREAWIHFQSAKRRNLSLAEIFAERKQGPAVDEPLPSDADLLTFELESSEILALFVYSQLSAEEHLTLSHLRDFLELHGDPEWTKLGTLLAAWCRGGTHGTLWDGPSNVQYLGRGAYFELGLLSESEKDQKIKALYLVANDIRQHLLTLPRATRKMILIEELSRMLEVPNSESLLREIFSQFRKFNVCCLTTLQTYSRIADTPLRPILMGNSRMFFIFNVTDPQDLARLGADIGLSNASQEAILRYPRPDQMTGERYSEFTYFHTDVGQPICGTARYKRLPATESSNS